MANFFNLPAFFQQLAEQQQQQQQQAEEKKQAPTPHFNFFGGFDHTPRAPHVINRGPFSFGFGPQHGAQKHCHRQRHS